MHEGGGVIAERRGNFFVNDSFCATEKWRRGRPWTRWHNYISDPAWARRGVKHEKLSEVTENLEVVLLNRDSTPL